MLGKLGGGGGGEEGLLLGQAWYSHSWSSARPSMVLSQLLLSLQTLHSSPDARQDKEQDQVSARVPKGKTHSRSPSHLPLCRLHHRSEPPAPSSPSEHFPTSRGLVTPTVTHSHTAL